MEAVLHIFKWIATFQQCGSVMLQDCNISSQNHMVRPLSLHDINDIMGALDMCTELDTTLYLNVKNVLTHIGCVAGKAAFFFHNNLAWVVERAPTFFRMLALTHAAAWVPREHVFQPVKVCK